MFIFLIDALGKAAATHAIPKSESVDSKTRVQAALLNFKNQKQRDKVSQSTNIKILTFVA